MRFLSISILIFLCSFVLTSCKNEADKTLDTQVLSKGSVEIKYAHGFAIENFDGYKVMTLKTAWPGTDKTFTYALVEKNANLPPGNFDAIVEIPVNRVVVTSTTHIPSLEMLGVADALIGFPNLDFISSEATRKNIDEGKIRELGRNEDINTEILIDIVPDVVVGFAVDGNNASFRTIEKTGIPVLYNSDWTENSPLGKAEWIKFFGVLFKKEKEADSIFNKIESEYSEAKKLAATASRTPTVIGGAMYRDVWYLPQGESWGARFIADANGVYLWRDSKGTGSLSLNLESVLEKGHDAEIWIGPGQFTSLKEIQHASIAYTRFKAFQSGNVFTYSMKKGPRGGLIYFEMAPNRPDLVLLDHIKMLHPELLPDYELHFFDKLR